MQLKVPTLCSQGWFSWEPALNTILTKANIRPSKSHLINITQNTFYHSQHLGDAKGFGSYDPGSEDEDQNVKIYIFFDHLNDQIDISYKSQ